MSILTTTSPTTLASITLITTVITLLVGGIVTVGVETFRQFRISEELLPHLSQLGDLLNNSHKPLFAVPLANGKICLNGDGKEGQDFGDGPPRESFSVHVRVL